MERAWFELCPSLKKDASKSYAQSLGNVALFGTGVFADAIE